MLYYEHRLLASKSFVKIGIKIIILDLRFGVNQLIVNTTKLRYTIRQLKRLHFKRVIKSLRIVGFVSIFKHI